MGGGGWFALELVDESDVSRCLLSCCAYMFAMAHNCAAMVMLVLGMVSREPRHPDSKAEYKTRTSYPLTTST